MVKKFPEMGNVLLVLDLTYVSGEIGIILIDIVKDGGEQGWCGENGAA